MGGGSPPPPPAPIPPPPAANPPTLASSAVAATGAAARARAAAAAGAGFAGTVKTSPEGIEGSLVPKTNNSLLGGTSPQPASFADTAASVVPTMKL